MGRQAYYVIANPKVELDNGKFSYVGKAIQVELPPNSNIVEYLVQAGVYKREQEIYEDSVSFDNKTLIEDELEQVNEILGIMFPPTGEEDYFFVKGKNIPEKFRDYKNQGYISQIMPVIQKLVAQEIPTEFKIGRTCEHIPLQESVSLMYSDGEYKKMMDDYYITNAAVVLGSEGTTSVGSRWNWSDSCPGADSDSSCSCDADGVFGLKFGSSPKKESEWIKVMA